MLRKVVSAWTPQARGGSLAVPLSRKGAAAKLLGQATTAMVLSLARGRTAPPRRGANLSLPGLSMPRNRG